MGRGKRMSEVSEDEGGEKKEREGELRYQRK